MGVFLWELTVHERKRVGVKRNNTRHGCLAGQHLINYNDITPLVRSARGQKEIEGPFAKVVSYWIIASQISAAASQTPSVSPACNRPFARPQPSLSSVTLLHNMSALPSSSSSPSDPVDENATDALSITATSRHVFPTYDLLRAFLSQYAAQHGFEIRWPANKGTVSQPSHSGAARCWCYLTPPTELTPEQQHNPSHPPIRNVIPRSANRSGNQIKCGCP